MKIEHKIQLKCDNPKCGYKKEIQEDEVLKYVETKCPKCGVIILTRADYESRMRYVETMKLFLQSVPQTETETGRSILNLKREKEQDGQHHLNIWMDGMSEAGKEDDV
jgi:predicted RNA-binding Zn-ribbon protein involved in translation (DUF1610 family)